MQVGSSAGSGAIDLVFLGDSVGSAHSAASTISAVIGGSETVALAARDGSGMVILVVNSARSVAVGSSKSIADPASFTGSIGSSSSGVMNSYGMAAGSGVENSMRSEDGGSAGLGNSVGLWGSRGS